MTPNASITTDLWLGLLKEVLGVSMRIAIVDFGAYYQHLEAEPPHMGYITWAADTPDPDNLLRVAYRHIQRYFGWRHQEYERLVEEARQLADPAARLALYRQADRILVQEASIIPYVHTPILHLLKPWVRRCPMSPLSTLSTWTALRDTVIVPHGRAAAG